MARDVAKPGATTVTVACRSLRVMRDHVAGAVLLAAIWAAPLVGQERVEIVPDEGRIVLGGIEWGLSEEVMAVDHVRRLIYVNDLSDPFAVLALSIEDGSLRGTYGAGEGDGPGEWRRPPAAGGRPGRRHGVGWWVRESLDRRWRPGFDVAAL